MAIPATSRLKAGLDGCPQTFLCAGQIAATPSLDAVPGPVWYESDRLSSRILLEGVLGTKGRAKCCLKGLWCITAHTATYSNLHLLEQREFKKSRKEKQCLQQNLSFPHVFQRVMQDTTVTVYASWKGPSRVHTVAVCPGKLKDVTVQLMYEKASH